MLCYCDVPLVKQARMTSQPCDVRSAWHLEPMYSCNGCAACSLSRVSPSQHFAHRAGSHVPDKKDWLCANRTQSWSAFAAMLCFWPKRYLLVRPSTWLCLKLQLGYLPFRYASLHPMHKSMLNFAIAPCCSFHRSAVFLLFNCLHISLHFTCPFLLCTCMPPLVLLAFHNPKPASRSRRSLLPICCPAIACCSLMQ